jgi:hypothetical protein
VGRGTGKSSIIKMYQESISDDEKVGAIYIDAWGYSNLKERFAPALLRKLAESLLDSCNSRKVIKKIDSRKEKVTTSHSMEKNGVILFFLILIATIGLTIWAATLGTTLLTITTFLLSSVILNGFLNWLLPKFIVTQVEKSRDVSFNEIEHYQKCFKEIIGKTKKTIISVSIDNIDRVEPVDALEMVRILKTFILDDDPAFDDRKLVYIVPCDLNQLAKHLESSAFVKNSYEFLQKIFNIIIYVPELVHENMGKFIKKHFNEVNNGLQNKLSEGQIDVVSFIISRGARNSPREVKNLINSFVSFWECASIVGTANKNISPEEAAFFITILSLLKGKDIPNRIEDLTKIYTSERNPSKEVTTFLSIYDIVGEISEEEWNYLRRLQLSEAEKETPNFLEVFNAVIDFNLEKIQTLLGKDINKIKILDQLDRRATEQGNIHRFRVAKWALHLIAVEEFNLSYVPPRTYKFISQSIKKSIKGWTSIMGEGLSIFLIKKKQPKEIIKKAFEEIIKEDSEKIAPARITQFIIKFLELRNDEYWNENKKLFNSIVEKASIANIEGNIELISYLIYNMDAIDGKDLGEVLSDQTIKNIGQLEIEQDKFTENFQVIENHSSISFSMNWLNQSRQANGISDINSISAFNWIVLGKNSTILLSTKELNKDEFPPEAEINALTNKVVELSANGLKNGKFVFAIDSFIMLGKLVNISKQIDRMSQKQNIENNIRQRIIPGLISEIGKVSSQERSLLQDNLELNQELILFISTDQLVNLSQYQEINVIPLVTKVNIKGLGDLLNKLYVQNHWKKAIAKWLQFELKQNNGEFVMARVFECIQGNSIYLNRISESVEVMQPLKNRKYSKRVIESYSNHLIESISWNSSDAVNQLIQIFVELGKLLKISEKNIDNLRIKLVEVNNSLNKNFIGLLSPETQKWLRSHLVIFEDDNINNLIN